MGNHVSGFSPWDLSSYPKARTLKEKYTRTAFPQPYTCRTTIPHLLDATINFDTAAIVQWQNAALWQRMSWVRTPLAAPITLF